MSDFSRRLDGILDRVTSDSFLRSEGLGNEIPFYAFDYPPEHEPEVRDHIRFLLDHIPKRRPDLKLAHADLFEVVVDLLEARGLYERAVSMQEKKGNEAVMKALAGPLKPERVAEALIEAVDPASQDLVLVSGVGAAYPLIRLHNLLNNLHPRMNDTPLVFFYPGIYDGQSLRLFGTLEDRPYYRAFRLVD